MSDPLLAPPPPPPNVLRTWQEAIALIRKQSSALQSIRARVQQAEAQTRIALAPALPQLTATGAVTHHLLTGEGVRDTDPPSLGTIPDPRTTFSAELGLRVPLLAPTAWYALGTAREAAEAARFDAREVERQQIAAVANAIVTAVTAERLAEVSRVSLQSALSTLELNKRRAALGAASTIDVLRTEQEVSLSRAQVVAADESVHRAREALGLALGSSEPWGITPSIRLDQLALDARTSCTPENRIDARPDVQAAEAHVRVAERDVKAVDYTYWPTLEAVSNVTYWSNDRVTANGENLTWTIGGLLTFRLYDGGLRYATRDFNRAALAAQRAELAEVRRQAAVEVSQALRAVRVAEANLEVTARSREIARETARLTRVAYLNGSGTSFDLVDAARRLRETELQFAIDEFEVLRARVAALLALATCKV
ncbi:MAG: TolC family protein [Pseudomonadota bacterium]